MQSRGRHHVRFPVSRRRRAGPGRLREPFEREKTALWLELTYTSPQRLGRAPDALIADLTAARQFAAGPPPGPLHPADPIAAVAAAAVAAHARGRAVVPDDDLRWAAEVLVEVAAHPRDEARSTPESSYRMGADRSAAAALPALLLPEFDHVRPGVSALDEALRHTGASVADEVRMIFAHASAGVWAASCGPAGTPAATTFFGPRCSAACATASSAPGTSPRSGGSSSRWPSPTTRRCPASRPTGC